MLAGVMGSTRCNKRVDCRLQKVHKKLSTVISYLKVLCI